MRIIQTSDIISVHRPCVILNVVESCSEKVCPSVAKSFHISHWKSVSVCSEKFSYFALLVFSDFWHEVSCNKRRKITFSDFPKRKSRFCLISIIMQKMAIFDGFSSFDEVHWCVLFIVETETTHRTLTFGANRMSGNKLALIMRKSKNPLFGDRV